MPLMVLTASSMRLVTCVSTSSGAAPRSVVVIVTTGKSIFGKRSTPELSVRVKPEHHQRHDQHGGEHRPLDTDFGELLHDESLYQPLRDAGSLHRCSGDQLIRAR